MLGKFREPRGDVQALIGRAADAAERLLRERFEEDSFEEEK